MVIATMRKLVLGWLRETNLSDVQLIVNPLSPVWGAE